MGLMGVLSIPASLVSSAMVSDRNVLLLKPVRSMLTAWSEACQC